jgi:hypothetical protein
MNVDLGITFRRISYLLMVAALSAAGFPNPNLKKLDTNRIKIIGRIDANYYYRIACYSWIADTVFKEMKQYGYYSFPNHGFLKDFVYRYVPSISGIRRKPNSASLALPRRPSFMAAGAD